MDYPAEIIIKNNKYQHVRKQRSGCAVYKNEASYLRIGETSKIHTDFTLHMQMEKLGFPVARIIGSGMHGDLSYFIEQSLGSESFADIFIKETNSNGHVDNESFEKFLNIIAVFAKAQLASASSKKDWGGFRSGIHLDLIIDELPNLKEEILNTYNESEKRLADFPFGILHGDLTPFNVYPDGIIDLEDSFVGPVSYDVGSFIVIQNWFPEKSDDQFHHVYKFTEEQMQFYTNTIDEIYKEKALPLISNYIHEFDVTKGIWFAVRMHNLPKLQRFRYNLIEKMVKS